jgi:polar amino acid transport system substrate-binding protein
MRPRRSVLTAAALASAGVLVVAGCSSAGAPRTLSAEPLAAPRAATNPARCNDGQPAVASLAPGGIGTDPGSWPAGSTMAKIKKRGRLIVGTSGDVLLWGSRNPKTGNLEGYDIDLLKAVAGALGVDPNKTEYRVINYAQRLPALDDGLVDVVAHTMTINCDRWQGSQTDPKSYINFSSEYFLAGQKVLVRSDSTAHSIQDLKGQPVCVAKGSTNLQNIANINVTKVVVDDLGECLVQFQEGEVVAITGDDTVLAGFAAQDPYAKVVGAAFSQEPYGLGTSPNAPDFTRFLNAVLEKLRADGTLTKIYNQTMGIAIPGAPAAPPAVYGRNISALKRAKA